MRLKRVKCPKERQNDIKSLNGLKKPNVAKMIQKYPKNIERFKRTKSPQKTKRASNYPK